MLSHCPCCCLLLLSHCPCCCLLLLSRCPCSCLLLLSHCPCCCLLLQSCLVADCCCCLMRLLVAQRLMPYFDSSVGGLFYVVGQGLLRDCCLMLYLVVQAQHLQEQLTMWCMLHKREIVYLCCICVCCVCLCCICLCCCSWRVLPAWQLYVCLMSARVV